MRIIEPVQFSIKKKPKSKPKLKIFSSLLLIGIVIIFTLSTWSYFLPLPTLRANAFKVSLSPMPANISWPKKGQAAVGALGYGVLAESKNQKPSPTASVAKVMLALAVLSKLPLKLNEEGPMLQLTKADEMLYSTYLAKFGSVVEVKAGEQISEYNSLISTLLPSANNMADTLAIWAFGSVSNYVSYANNLAKSLNLNSTHIADASGFSPKTVSTAHDLVLLGQQALKNPVITQIVSKKSAKIAMIGEVKNTNRLLGINGITGIKTGNTDEAGGCYLVSTKTKLSTGQEITLIGAVMGAATMQDAMITSQPLFSQQKQFFQSRKLVNNGQKIGYYQLPWGGQISAFASDDMYIFDWVGASATASVNLNNLNTSAHNESVGYITYAGQKVFIKTDALPNQPSLKWRLLRWL